MKKISLFALLISIMFSAIGQELSEENQTPASKPEETKVAVGKDKFTVEENDSTTTIKLQKRAITIDKTDDKVTIEKYSNAQDSSDKCTKVIHCNKKKNKFKGHWAGVELGFNNYLTSDNSFVVPDDIDYMSLSSSKSSSFNINFAQLNIGLTKHIGFVTGLGLNWNNYRFSGDNNILEGNNGIIEILDPGYALKKSKLTTLYIHLPFLIEFQLPVDNHHINLAAGPIGAVKIGSHTKMVYENKDKVKSNGDFSLNLLRYGATARIGYENFQLYSTYYFTPLFNDGKGPGEYDLYPFEIGFAFTFND